MRRYLLHSLTLVVIAAQAAEPVRVQLPGFHCTGSPYSIKLPAKMSQLRRLGNLQKEDVVGTEEWDGYKAIEVALHFPGLSVGAITFTNDPERYNLSAARISSSQWSLSQFRVGQPAESLLRGLGVKGQTSNGSWRFEGESDALILEIKGARFKEVIYECYTG